MVDYEYGTLFNDDSVKKEIIIKYGNTTITNEDLFNQELELDESLCSDDQLKFGSCEASVIKFRVANIVSPVKGNWISVAMAIDGRTENPIQFGRYRVESDKPTSDRKWREIVAYDALYDMINDDVSVWYNSVLPNKNTSMPLSQFRKLFLQKYGVQEEIGEPLVNDGMIVTRTIDPEELSGAKVITAICELNGCFGHIDRNGKFKSVQLIQGIKGLYPRNDLYPANDIYPRDPKSTPIGKGIYISCEYEDFIVNSITGVDIYKEENSLGISYGSTENKYVVEDNFLVYGKSDQDLRVIANNLLSAIRGLDYRPFDAECKGNPRFEVGDPVRLSTKYEIVESYILSRTLKGTQALKDSYSAGGTEKYEIKVNSARRETAQLSGKAEQLERVSEEQQEHINRINSDIGVINQDIGEVDEKIGNLNISLKKTNEGLQAEVSRAISAEETIGSRVSITENNIDLEVRRAKGAEETLSGRINITESNISLEVQRAKGAESSLSSRINLTESSIDLEVQRAQNAESNLSSRISMTESSIDLKVSKGDVVSQINMSSDTIVLSSGRIMITSGNCTLDGSGNIGVSGGRIGDFYINSGSLVGTGTRIDDNTLTTNTLYTRNIEVKPGYNWLYISGETISMSGNIRLDDVYSSTTSDDANVNISSGGALRRKSGSSRRWKSSIGSIDSPDIDAHRLYNVRPRQFVYNDGYLSLGDRRSGRFIPGFIAEELQEDYPIAVEYDEQGNPANWGASFFIAPMLQLIQEHKAKLDDHDGLINRIIQKIGGI